MPAGSLIRMTSIHGSAGCPIKTTNRASRGNAARGSQLISSGKIDLKATTASSEGWFVMRRTPSAHSKRCPLSLTGMRQPPRRYLIPSRSRYQFLSDRPIGRYYLCCCGIGGTFCNCRNSVDLRLCRSQTVHQQAPEISERFGGNFKLEQMNSFPGANNEWDHG